MNWKLVAMAFGTLFLAELGDKTQLAVFTMASQHKQPWPIFIGASLGLTVVTALGAFFGGFITKFVPEQVIQTVAGMLFVGIGISVLWSAVPDLLKFIGR